MNDMIASIAAFKSPTFHFNPSQGPGRRGRGGFFRGNGRGGGRGRGQNRNEQNNQSNPPGSNGQSGHAQSSGGIPKRQPFCFYCKQQGAERSDHWPNRCQLLTHALKEYHDHESRTGHTDHQANTSEQYQGVVLSQKR